MKKWLLYGMILFSLVACGLPAERKTQPSVVSVSHPAFSSDSAYMFIQKQVDFGARVPGTEEHAACVDYIVRTLESFGAAVVVQQGYMTDYAGQPGLVKNIIASFGDPKLDAQRVLLSAHFDSRPWCDHDQSPANWEKPVLGANDGASGVGILLEVARQIQLLNENQEDTLVLPVDMVFFDCEDMGTPEFYQGERGSDTWCLGSQMWAAKITSPQMYKLAILLDMVGAPDATFYQEGYSLRYAKSQVIDIWNKAAGLGYANYFIPKQGGVITDDHFYVNQAGIPCVDIIDYRPTGTGFPLWWHTTDDNMNNINRQTLQAVGETVMSMILN